MLIIYICYVAKNGLDSVCSVHDLGCNLRISNSALNWLIGSKYSPKPTLTPYSICLLVFKNHFSLFIYFGCSSCMLSRLVISDSL